MSPNDAPTPFVYELPKTPKSIMDAWMPRLQAVAIVTALLAGIEVQLITNLPDPTNRPADTAVRFFAYSGLILNLGATLSTILLLIAIASLPTTARQIYVSCSHGYPRQIFHHSLYIADLNDKLLKDRGQIYILRAFGISHGETYVLGAFGIARGWTLMLCHCIACFLGGSLCSFVHISLNLWLTESTVVAAILMPAVAFGFVPPFVVLMFFMGSPACNECSADKK